MSGRAPRQLVASLVLAVVGVTVLSVAVLSVAGPAAAQTEDPPPAATIALADRSPWVGDGVPLTLDVVVSGDTAGTTMRARIHPPLEDPGDLETSLDEDVGGITRSVDLGFTDEIPVEASGARRITLTGDDIRIPGVHPVVVELRSAGGEVLGLVRTPVIRLGTDDDPLPAPRLSVVVDVGVDPTVGPDARRELTDSELRRLEGLAAFLDEAASLDRPPPITVLPVPDTLDALAASSDPRSAAVLESVLAAATDAPSAVPYVPVSAAALAEAGLGDVLGTVRAAGTLVLAELVGTEPSPAIWPDDDVDPAAGAVLAAAGVTTVLTNETGAADTQVDPGERLLVPAGPRRIPALDEVGLSAVVVDEETTDELTGPVDERADALPVAMADLLLRDDGRDSSVVVRVDEVPETSQLAALLELFTDPAAPITIGALPTSAAGRDPDDEDLPDPITLPTGSGDDLTEISTRYRAVDARVATFDGFLGTESSRIATLRVQQWTSVANGLVDADRLALLDAVDAVVTSGFDAVALTGQTDLNLTSRSGSLPIAIENTNDYPVRVLVRIRSDRLRFPDGEEFEVIAEPDVTRLEVPVEALATGSVPTQVEIRTPDGVLQLDSRQLNVRSTAVSGVGLAISLGALAVLAVWWVRSWRRGRSARTDDGARTSDR